MIKHILHEKKKGFSTMILSMFIIFFIIVFVCIGMYMRAADILNQFVRNDADSATMAAAVINIDTYNADRKFQIIGSADETTNNISADESAEVYDRFHKYASSLVTTMGITSTGFSGGNLGWAATQLGVCEFVIDDFYIYDYVNGTLIEYKISDITLQQLVNAANNSYNGLHITKRVGTSGSLSSTPFQDYRRSDKQLPTVFATFSFNLNLPRAFMPIGSDSLSERVTVNSIAQVEQS